MDEPSHDDYRPPVRMENTYQLGPNKRFPTSHIKDIIKDVLESYLCEEKYEPELCRQMTKTVSEVCFLEADWFYDYSINFNMIHKGKNVIHAFY